MSKSQMTGRSTGRASGRAHECRMHLVDDAKHGSYGRGHAGGTSCEVAEFKSWKPREIARLDASKRVIGHSGDLALAAAEIIGVDMTTHEHMLLIGVDTRNRIVAVADGSSRARDMCAVKLVDAVAALFAESLMTGGKTQIAATFMAHNHPQGTPRPSDEDVHFTKKAACQFRVVPLMDHVIVWLKPDGKVGHYTMGDEHPRVFVPPAC